MALYVIYGLIAFLALAVCLHFCAFVHHILAGVVRLIGHLVIGPWLIFDIRRKETTVQPRAEYPRNLRVDGTVQFRVLHRFGRPPRYWLACTGFRTPQISVREYQRLSDAQRFHPVCVYQRGGLSWWWYRDRFWQASGHDPAEVPDKILETAPLR